MPHPTGETFSMMAWCTARLLAMMGLDKEGSQYHRLPTKGCWP